MDQTASSIHIIAGGDLDVNIASFGRHLRAENLSPRTLETYTEAARQFTKYLVEQGMPLEVANIHREHVEAFISHLLDRWKPATANNRFRGLQTFFKWLTEEGEVKESPMARMKPPKVPLDPPDVLRDEQLLALLATCDKGQETEDRRDAAVIRVFIDTGARLSEVTNLRWHPTDDSLSDVDLERGILRVLGKGRRERVLAVGRKTVRALDRYLRKRSTHRDTDLPLLWLGIKGRMSESGIRADHTAARASGWLRCYPPPPATPLLCPYLAKRGRHRKRPDAARRMEQPDHDSTLRRQYCHREGVIGAPASQSGR